MKFVLRVAFTLGVLSSALASIAPTEAPTTIVPTLAPTTVVPTLAPTSVAPSEAPTTLTPTLAPTTVAPTLAPTTETPTVGPTLVPTAVPTTEAPTLVPTTGPTEVPSLAPTSLAPTLAPTTGPTLVPTTGPTETPTLAPTSGPTPAPTHAPTSAPTEPGSLPWFDSDPIFNNWLNSYLALPSASHTRTYLQNLTAEAHLAGTETRTSDYVHALFQSFGLNSTLQRFPARLQYPISRAVQLVSPAQFNASLVEPPFAEDPTSNRTDAVMTFNGYGADGDVTAELVYANFGLVEDFEALAALNVSVEGKIVIVRYGRSFRGSKVQLAEERGAVAVLLYSDPKEDGFVRGTEYPAGPWRPQFGAQRGSTQFLMTCPGNPVDERLEICFQEGSRPNTTLGHLVPRIPVIPLSWGDAEPLLRNLTGGPTLPSSDWQGGLSFNYSIGPGPARVRVFSNNSNVDREIVNVLANITGTEFPNEYVLLGNHRDAWVFGAVDPSSGTAVLLDMARSLGELMRAGWRPRRSIILGSWDGEEYGLIGSTYYGEDGERKQTLVQNSIAYVNVDTAVSGPNFAASSSPSLRPLVRWASEKVRHATTNRTIRDDWNGQIGVLGSGSDYTVFLHHLGIPSIDFDFGGNYGVYHSIYDSFTWMTLHGDPGFEYHRMSSAYIGALALALSSMQILPFSFASVGTEINRYIRAVEDEARRVGVNVSFTALASAQTTYASGAQSFEGAVTSLWTRRTNDTVDVSSLRSLNDIARNAERAFLFANGLPNRFWFKHILQAPDRYLGYGSDMLPGISEAIRDRDLARTEAQIAHVATIVTEAATKINQPTSGSGSSSVGLIVGLLAGLVFVIILVVLYFRRRGSGGSSSASGGYSSMRD